METAAEGKSPDDKLGPPPPKKAKTDPDSWNVGTQPFEVVRYFAKDEITDEAIKCLLMLHQIQTLQKLKDEVAELVSILKKSCNGALVDSINAAMLRTQTKPAEFLGGEVEVETTCITKDLLQFYTPGAVSFNDSPTPPTHGQYQRTPNFTLVMGPSGSGKTMFALQYLPEMVFPGAISKKKSFRIHLKAWNLLGDAPPAAFDLPGEVVKHVNTIVARCLSETFGNVVVPIDLFLFVIIDEAGGTPYRVFFNEAVKIEAIVAALKTMNNGYNFGKGVHVVLAGTALETSTQGMSSGPDAIKIRMQPLSFDNFIAMLQELKKPDGAMVQRMVQRFPILTSLTSNARCANLLAGAIPSLLHVTEQRWPAYVDASVSEVVRKYAMLNGLRNLQSMDQKFIVAQEAFRVLDHAMDEASGVFFPSLDHIHDERLRSVTQSLFDINVEIISGKPTLIGQSYSVSMTPAITIVLAELLCEKAALSWNWQGVEITAALGEWKRMITSMEIGDFTSACGIICMQSPVPHERTQVRFTLPVVSRSTVLLNGPAAPYADVMAPFRLLQARFSLHSAQDQKLDFHDEIGKMGLSTDSNYQLKQAVTSVLYVMWQQSHSENNDDNYLGSTVQLATCNKGRCEHYPFQTLLCLWKPAHRTASFVINNNLLLPDKRDPEATALLRLKPINVLEEFSSEQPLTAVFVTNCKRFILTADEAPPVVIAREDVDWRGKLKSKSLPDHLVANLRENVEIGFMFY